MFDWFSIQRSACCIATVFWAASVRGVEFQGVPAESYPAALQVQIEPSGEATLVNVTEWPVGLSGYTLACEAGCLQSTDWRNFHDQAVADEANMVATYGEGVLTLRVIGQAPASLSEVSVLENEGALLPPHHVWTLGQVVRGTPSEIEELLAGDSLSLSWSGAIIPEPSGAVLAAIATVGAAATARRRRRV